MVAVYFLFRQDNIWLNLAGVIFALVFPFISITFWFDIQLLYLLVKNTFSFLHRILTEIQTYIDNISLISSQKEKIFKDNIEDISNKTVKEFIHEELRQLDYNSKKIHVFQLIIAFMMSFIVILITGDEFVILIKKLANLINIATLFPIINDLNVQTFWLIFLFPLSIAWARDLVVEVSKKYSKELYQSLFIIDLYENG